MHRYRFQIGSTDALERKLDEVTLLTCPLLLSRTFMHRYRFQISSTDALERKLDEVTLLTCPLLLSSATFTHIHAQVPLPDRQH